MHDTLLNASEHSLSHSAGGRFDSSHIMKTQTRILWQLFYIQKLRKFNRKFQSLLISEIDLTQIILWKSSHVFYDSYSTLKSYGNWTENFKIFSSWRSIWLKPYYEKTNAYFMTVITRSKATKIQQKILKSSHLGDRFDSSHFCFVFQRIARIAVNCTQQGSIGNPKFWGFWVDFLGKRRLRGRGTSTSFHGQAARASPRGRASAAAA